MALSAGEFVLPSFGGDPGQALQGLTNSLYMRNMQQQRLSLQQEAKRQQSGQFLERFLDPKQYLSGTAYDPMIVSSINEALQKGAQMAQQGADIPTMLMGLGQYTNRINDYSNKAKLINKQADDTIAKLKETGAKGYDYAALKDLALKKAFHNIDPKTGQDLGLQQDMTKVDPSQNYVLSALSEHPDQVTNAGDFDEFAKNSERVKTLIDKQRYTGTGTLNREKLVMSGQNWLEPDYDEKSGKVKELVPRYEHATNAGSPLMHTFTDQNGKESQAPVRLLDQKVFDDLVQRKGVGDYLRGQVMKHLREYESPDGQQLTLDSPQAHLVARAIAYDELKNRRGGGVEETGIQNKPSAQEVGIRLFGDREQRAYDSRYGRGEAEYDLDKDGLLPKKNKKGNPKENTVDAINEVATHNPEYLQGDPEERDGSAVIDVLNQLPKAQLKYGPMKGQSYKHAYYDPEAGAFTLIKNDKKAAPEVIQRKDMPKFLHSIATANGVENKYVDKSLSAYGFKGGNYEGGADAPDLHGAIAEHRATIVNNALSAETETQRSNALKDAGLRIPEGTVTGLSERGGMRIWGGASPYALDYKKPNGDTDTKYFKSKQDMEDYLKKPMLKSKAAPAAAPTADDPTSNLTPEEKAAYKKYQNQ